MRILHIVSSLEPSGTTKQLELVAAGLPQDEFEIQIASLRSDKAAEKVFQLRGIETVSVGWRGRLDPRAFRKLWQLIRRWRPDIVHTWNSEANSVGRLTAKMASLTRIVASERHINPDRSGLERVIDRWLVRWTSCIITNSAAVREFELARGAPAEKLRFLPSGVPEFNAESIDRGELLDELGLPPDAKLIAYLGPLVRQKRLKELVWATDQLKAVGVPAHLLLIGDGPQRQALARYRFLNRIDDRVHLLGWRSDVARLLSQVEVVWQPSAYEGHSYAILEAMAAAIPVVAADATGNCELISHGENGYLVPLKERAGFARWTLPLLEDSALATKLGAAGRQRVLTCHRLEDMISAHAKLYRAL
jgi:glycosyltransferase involved in cell wall biosynthesis